MCTVKVLVLQEHTLLHEIARHDDIKLDLIGSNHQIHALPKALTHAVLSYSLSEVLFLQPAYQHTACADVIQTK